MGQKKAYPIKEMKESLEKLEAEAERLKGLARGFPSVEKNIDPIMTFVDILNFHIGDLPEEDVSI